MRCDNCGATVWTLVGVLEMLPDADYPVGLHWCLSCVRGEEET